jgi:hypothetical protein
VNSNFQKSAELTGDKRFARLHKVFNDAVQSKNEAAVVEVLLRAELSGDNARRTAQKILADRSRQRSDSK